MKFDSPPPLSPDSPTSPAPDSPPRPATLGPPQFRLRTLLLAVAAASILFAILQALEGQSALVLLMFLGLIAAHVIGNALGTRLRDQASLAAQVGGDAVEPPPPHGDTPIAMQGSQLTEHRRLPRSLLGVATVGAVLGGIAGGGLITVFTWEHITPAGIALGVGSSAVLGGLFGFLASSFYTVARGAWREALGEQTRERTPQ